MAIMVSTDKGVDLPLGIIEADTKYPVKAGDRVYDVGDHGCLTFYKTKGFGWIIATLGIKRSRNGAGADRTYGIRIDTGTVCRVGFGPHVIKTVRVYVTKKRQDKLKKFLELYDRGMQDAGAVRDRISSRRAEGSLRRSRGERSWRWDN